MTSAKPTRSSQRIWHVTFVHPASDVRIAHKECVALAQAGYDISLVAPDGYIGPPSVIRWIRIPSRNRLARVVSGMEILWLIWRGRPAVAHFHDPELLPVAWLTKRAIRIPLVIYDAHEDLESQVHSKPWISPSLRPLVARLVRLMLRLTSGAIDAVVLANETTAPRFERSRLLLVRNYPWARDFQRSEIAADRTGAVYVGSISNARGFAEMVEATKLAGLRLTLAGPLAPEAASSRLLDEPHVNYVGTIPPNAIPDLLSTQLVGLCVLHPEPHYLVQQPTKVFDYMAAGLPFVASDFPSWVAEFGGENAGLFVDPTDVASIVTALDEIANSSHLYEEMSAAGRRAFTDRFSFDADSRTLVEFLDSSLLA